MRILCCLSTEVKLHFREEACVIERKHDHHETREAQDEQKNPVLILAQEVKSSVENQQYYDSTKDEGHGD